MDLNSCKVLHSQKKRFVDGHSIPFDIFSPVSENDSADLLPCVLLLHGFALNRVSLRRHAIRLAEMGTITFSPDMISLLGGECQQEKNIKLVVSHVEWMRTFEGIDPTKIVLVGHSAGGAVALEACIELGARGNPVLGLVLLDAVPWSRTTNQATAFPVQTYFASLISAPSAWNNHCSIRSALNIIKSKAIQFDSYILHESCHGDVIFPYLQWTSLLSFLLRGLVSNDKNAYLYSHLLDALLFERILKVRPKQDLHFSMQEILEGNNISAI